MATQRVLVPSLGVRVLPPEQIKRYEAGDTLAEALAPFGVCAPFV